LSKERRWRTHNPRSWNGPDLLPERGAVPYGVAELDKLPPFVVDSEVTDEGGEH
jgi:hypothetical protein